MTVLPNKCDVAVVGLGPAGSMAALRLARLGVDVVALERSEFPRYKVCGGCLNTRAVNAMVRAGLNPGDLGGVAIDRFEASFGQRRLSLALPGGLAVSRARLDAFLANGAVESGALVAFNAKCAGLEKRGDGWRVQIERQGVQSTLGARMVIGADGIGGPVRRSGDFRTTVAKSSRIGAGLMLDDSAGYETGAIYMAVGRQGYVGLTVVEDGCLNVAAALDPEFVREQGSPGATAQSILNGCGFPIPAGLGSGAWKGTPPLSQRTWPVAVDGILLAGDCAAYVEPFTGEGMSWAMEGATELSEIVAESVKGGATDAESRWNTAYRRRFQAAQRRCGWISKGLRSPAVSDTVAGVLRAVPVLARPVIANLNTIAE